METKKAKLEDIVKPLVGHLAGKECVVINHSCGLSLSRDPNYIWVQDLDDYKRICWLEHGDYEIITVIDEQTIWLGPEEYNIFCQASDGDIAKPGDLMDNNKGDIQIGDVVKILSTDSLRQSEWSSWIGKKCIVVDIPTTDMIIVCQNKGDITGLALPKDSYIKSGDPVVADEVCRDCKGSGKITLFTSIVECACGSKLDPL